MKKIYRLTITTTRSLTQEEWNDLKVWYHDELQIDTKNWKKNQNML